MLFQTHVSYAAKLFCGTKKGENLKNVHVPPHYMTMAVKWLASLNLNKRYWGLT